MTRRYKTLFAGVAGVLLVTLLVIAPSFGATWDEPQQRAKALRLIAYLEGRTPALDEPLDGAHLYGAPFDVVAAALEPLVPVDPYVIRHEIIALVAWTGLVLCGLVGDRSFGRPVGLIAMILLASSPLYIAHATNNPKDLPFATVGTAVLLALTFVRGAEVLSWPLTVALAACIGLGLNVRPGALLFLPYCGVVVLFWLLQAPGSRGRLAMALAGKLVVVAGAALAVGWVAWPWAYGHPLRAPFQALAELNHFGWSGTVLFEGRSISGSALPPGYLPTWFWLTTPPVLAAGTLLSVIAIRDAGWRNAAIALWGSILFPLFYVIGTRATLYDGPRHMLFVLPPVAVLSAAGWVACARARPGWTPAVCALFVLGLCEPVAFQFRNHPNQTAYIQPLAGGPRAAFARYDLDYWGNCILASMTDASEAAGARPLVVTGWPMIVMQADASRFPNLHLTGPDDPAAALEIILARGTSEDLLKLSMDPTVVGRVSTADGAMLCATRTLAPSSPRRAAPPDPED